MYIIPLDIFFYAFFFQLAAAPANGLLERGKATERTAAFLLHPPDFTPSC